MQNDAEKLEQYRSLLEQSEFLLRKLLVHPHDVLHMRDSIKRVQQEISECLITSKEGA